LNAAILCHVIFDNAARHRLAYCNA